MDILSVSGIFNLIQNKSHPLPLFTATIHFTAVILSRQQWFSILNIPKKRYDQLQPQTLAQKDARKQY